MYLRSGAILAALLLAGCAGGPPKPGPESLDLNPGMNNPGATSTAA
ncbi:MAG: MlaA family lipoprotein, partial [Aeromonas sobria]